MNTLEQLAVWYLRLNGYFVIPNFVAHGQPSSQTEVDVLAVRFPHSQEYPDDVGVLQIPAGKTDVLLAEVKASKCKINPPWKGGSKGDPLENVLRRVGLFDASTAVEAANELYTHRLYPPRQALDSSSYIIRMVCFGNEKDQSLRDVTQILWPGVILFIGSRFHQYEADKADHDHWDRFGKFLWDSLKNGQTPTFTELVDGWHRKCQCWP
jgi:hypothetical protein